MSSGIGTVRFHPISKLGGSGFTRPDLDFRSLRISDFRRFSMGKESGLVVVDESGEGKSGDWFEVQFMVVGL